ncbi:DUF3426 domain-containing protein [Aliikangiella marina]|uniref:DUF3426 domain-containing protein n=1 Tax=Aliikangiella marina TaxID=1712262 RepID=A0A545T5A8_9GAMM|nr:zinc-ribbon and DUF3426 domain-containing protein [Aliikangiella marina]TQV72399.1 DUF3426 domain-containing protein [Aliikangiella marina]
MTDNSQYTRCPQCKTAFKVSEKMLAMAHGKVRCGACLEVFQATDHILKPRSSSQAVTPSSLTQATLTQSQSATTSSIASPTGYSEVKPDESPISDWQLPDAKATKPTLDFEPAESPESENIEHQLNSEKSDSDFTSLDHTEVSDTDVENADVTETHLDDIDVEGEQVDPEISLNEEFEDALDDPLQDEEVDIAEESLGAAVDEPDLSALDADHLVASRDELEDEHGQPLSEQDDSNLDEVLARMDSVEESLNESPLTEADNPEFEPELEEQMETYAADQAVESDLSIDEMIDEAFADDPDISEQLVDEQALEQGGLDDFEDGGFVESDVTDFDESLDSDQLALADSQELEILSDNLAEQIHDSDVEPDPLEEFEERVEKKKTSLRTLMLSAVVLGVLGYLSVNFWSNRQTLAYDETWGGLTQTLCGALPCDIQPRKDTNRISLQQRIVTPSETQENFLDIKIVLVNQANFAQAYPEITIDFTNENDQVVAVKQFNVSEYFPEKQGQLMPPNAEIHIAWTIEQPHPEGLGFRFSFN